MEDPSLEFPDELPVGQLLKALSKGVKPVHSLTVQVLEGTLEDRDNSAELTRTKLFASSAAAAADGTAALDLAETPTASSSSSRQVEALSTCLRDSHQQKRLILEQVCADKQVWEAQTQATEARLQRIECLSVQHLSQLRLELEHQHALEVERLQGELEASVAQASWQAAQVTNEYRRVRAAMQQQALAMQRELKVSRDAQRDLSEQLEAKRIQLQELESERSVVIPELERQLSDLQAHLQSELGREKQRSVQLEDELLEALNHIELLEDYEDGEIARQDELIEELQLEKEQLAQELKGAREALHSQSENRQQMERRALELTDLMQRLLQVSFGLLTSKLGESSACQRRQPQLNSNPSLDVSALEAQVQLVESLHAQVLLDEALGGPKSSDHILPSSRNKTAPPVPSTLQCKLKAPPPNRKSVLKPSRMSLAPSFKPDTTPRERTSARNKAVSEDKENAANARAMKPPSTSSKPAKRPHGSYASSSSQSALPNLRGSALKPPGTSHLTRPMAGKPRSRLEKYGTTHRSVSSSLAAPQGAATKSKRPSLGGGDRSRSENRVGVHTETPNLGIAPAATSADESLDWSNVGRTVSNHIADSASSGTGLDDAALAWSNVGQQSGPPASESKEAAAEAHDDGFQGWRNVGRFLPQLGIDAGETNGLESKTSPKILIKNVLQSLSPKASSIASTVRVPASPGEQPFVPAETIEMTPCEPKVEHKFDSLYSNWSTCRKPEPSGSPSEHSHVLRIQFSTVKKTKRDDPTTVATTCTAAPPTRKRLKRNDPVVLETPARIVGERMVAGTAAVVQATPLFDRGELVSMLSPEELLLSPVPAAKYTISANLAVKPTSTTFSPTVCDSSPTRQASPAVEAPVEREPASLVPSKDVGVHGSREREFAASTIATCYRSHWTSKHYKAKRTAAIQIQRWARRHAAAAAVKRAKSMACRRIQGAWRIRTAQMQAARCTLAIRLQAHSRRHLALKRFQGFRNKHRAANLASLRIQTAWRGHQCKVRYQRLRRSAIVLQAVFRGMISRHTYTAKTLSHNSHATLIQQAWRQTNARKKFIEMLCASMILQSVWRDSRVRVQLRSIRQLSEVHAAIRIQNSWRSHYQRQCYCRTQRLSIALQHATQIQRIWRGTSSQKKYVEMLCACMIIQSVGRGAISRRKLRCIQAASTSIQRAWRSRRARIQFSRLILSTMLVQCAFRRNHFRRQCEKRRTAARHAIVIQRSWRCSFARRQFIETLCAAMILQSVWRGCCARKALHSQMIVEKATTAAIQVQSAWRARISRILFTKIRCMVIVIQCLARRQFARTKAQQLQAARRHVRNAIIIQKNWRCVSYRNKYVDLLCASMIVQSVWRGARGRLEVQSIMHERRRQFSSLALQKIWRAYHARIKYKRHRKSVSLVQSLARRLIARRRLHSLKTIRQKMNCAIHIQRCWRRSTTRNKYIELLCASMIVQSVWRGHRARKQIQILFLERQLVLSSLMIQTCWRSYSSRVGYAFIRKSVIIIQNLVRQHIARNHLNMLKSHRQEVIGATIIQSRWRMCLAKLEYAKANCAVTTIQSIWRGVHARRQVKSRILSQLRDRSSLKIQTKWRSYVARQKFRRERNFIILVQCLVRQKIAEVLVKHEAERHQDQSAFLIQQQWRRFNSRRKYKILLRAVLALQSMWRESSVRQKEAQNVLRKQVVAAVVVQKNWRSHSAQHLLSRNIHFVLVVQSLVRRKLASRQREALKSLKKANFGAIVVQKQWRSSSARKTFKRLLHSTLKLQSVWRRYVSKQVARSRRQSILESSSSIFLQSIWRSRMAQLRFTHQRQALIVIQSFCRRELAWRKTGILRAKHTRLESSGTQLQRWWRSTTARKKFIILKQAAVKIQSVWRSVAQRFAFLQCRSTVVLLQAVVRRNMAKANCATLKEAALKQRNAAVCLQRHWRGFRQYRVYLALSRVAMEKKRVEALALTPVSSTTRSTRLRPSAPPVEGTVRRSKTNSFSSEMTSVKTAKRVPFGHVETVDKCGSNLQLNSRNRTPKPMKFPGGAKLEASPLHSFKSRDDVEKLKVVELRELLVQHGVEKKVIRTLRKAELVTMVMDRWHIIE